MRTTPAQPVRPLDHRVENRVYADSVRRHLMAALERTFAALPRTQSKRDAVAAPIKQVLDTDMEPTSSAPATAAHACLQQGAHRSARSSATAWART